MKVRIGITSGWEPGTVVEGWPLVYANKGAIEYVEKHGAIPVMIPVLEDVSLYDEYMKFIDAIIVSGEVLSIKRNVVKDGGDNPLYSSNPLRYENEKAAINSAIKSGIPILGICRGYQVMNVELGGNMKDGDITIDNPVIHQQGGIELPNVGVHEISIKEDTKLHSLLNVDEIMVNSFHRQAVGDLPKGFIASASTKDGHIEAIETDDDRFIIGVQFHPEMLTGDIWDNFFKEFIKVARNSKNNESCYATH